MLARVSSSYNPYALQLFGAFNSGNVRDTVTNLNEVKVLNTGGVKTYDLSGFTEFGAMEP